MAQIDFFANQLLEEAKRFLEKAKESPDAAARSANLHAALMLGFCALEAHINAICEEFSSRAGLSAHEVGLLVEREVRLEVGEFRLKDGLKMARIEDRIEFLHAKFSGKPINRASAWWGQLREAAKLRNHLTHAKEVPEIGHNAVENALQAIVGALDALYQAIYKRSLPAASRGLQSRLTF